MTQPTEVVKVAVVELPPPPPQTQREAPERLSTRSFQFPPSGMAGSPVQSVASRNNARARMVVSAPAVNTQPAWITDQQQIITSHGFMLAPGASVILESTAQVFAWGTAGDTLCILEESYNV